MTVNVEDFTAQFVSNYNNTANLETLLDATEDTKSLCLLNKYYKKSTLDSCLPNGLKTDTACEEELTIQNRITPLQYVLAKAYVHDCSDVYELLLTGYDLFLKISSEDITMKNYDIGYQRMMSYVCANIEGPISMEFYTLIWNAVKNAIFHANLEQCV